MGKILAYSGVMQDCEVTWMPSYGPEMRGGTANCSVIISDDPIGSPIISEPDILVAMNLPSLDKYEGTVKKGGKIIMSTQEIDPMPVIIGAAQYPENLVEKMKEAGADVDAIDALDLAMQAGSSKAVNLVLMGRLSKYFDALQRKF